MGKYINPPSETKEDWLAKNAKSITRDEFMNFDFPGESEAGNLAIVLADNGPFTAAAVMDRSSELLFWQKQDATDPRRLKYFKASREDLTPVTG